MKSLASILLFWVSAAAQALPQNQQRLSPHNDPSAIKKPNFVFILVDDQDLQLDSLSYLPVVKREFGEKGTFYSNHFVTTAICCPSRVSLWTGRHAHNTNVTDVVAPYGGYTKFVAGGFNDNYLPVWLQAAGYNTYYTGKLFNQHTIQNYNSPHPKGFNGSDFLLDPFTYSYLNPAYQRNNDPPVLHRGNHTADLLAGKAYGFLDDALAGDRPFFVTIAPVSPHSNVEFSNHDEIGHGHRMTKPIPLPRHSHLFPEVKVPRTEHFNPDKSSGVSWVAKLPKQSQENVDANDEFYRARLQALQSVDELVEGVVKKLEEAKVLDTTYIIYSSDNGFHIGQHRLQPGKECGFEEDIRVPLFIRGPKVPAGGVVDAVTTHIDLAPTIFDLAGIDSREDFDGTPIPVREDSLVDENFLRHEHVGIEFWGKAIGEGEYPKSSDLAVPNSPILYLNNTYKALRIIGPGYNFYYSVWCNNQHELYDLHTDPYQLNNLYPGYRTEDLPQRRLMGGFPIYKVLLRLDALLFVLKSCKSVTCVKPWNVLHPEGNVENLRDALEVEYDFFYDAQHKIWYDRCELGYILDAEGPQTPSVYRSGMQWSEWT